MYDSGIPSHQKQRPPSTPIVPLSEEQKQALQQAVTTGIRELGTVNAHQLHTLHNWLHRNQQSVMQQVPGNQRNIEVRNAIFAGIEAGNLQWLANGNFAPAPPQR